MVIQSDPLSASQFIKQLITNLLLIHTDLTDPK